MPNVISGNTDHYTSLDGISYDYNYLSDHDFRPRSSNKLHQRIKTSVMQKARASHSVISNRFDSWNEIDKLLVSYISADDEERKVKGEDSRKPVSIVFPYSYAVMETLLTYLTLARLQDPIFHYEGSSPEDTVGAIMLELVVQKHCQKNKVALNLHTMYRDSLAYGIGPVAPGWEVRRGTRRVMREEGRISSGIGRLLGREPVHEEHDSILFEGNNLSNIDPYNVLPDPSVSIHETQKGEFFGWVEETNLSDLLRREQNDEDYFNCLYLKHLKNRKIDFHTKNQQRNAHHGIDKTSMGDEVSTVQIVHMYIDILPREWKLGESEYPEKWLFSIAGGEVIIRAQPLGMNHGMYPVAIAAPTFDGYSTSPISKLETLFGLQETLNWLFNSHIANVRKAVNDMLVVDPYMINIKDLQNPGPGKLLRMRRPAWGRGVKDAVMQLNVNDVTRQNISDSAWILSWMNNIVGSDESMMGSLRQSGPERLTKGEFEGTRSSAMSRLQYLDKIMNIQALQDIAYFFASHTQQLMSEDTYVKTIGEWEDRLRTEYNIKDGKMKVSPSDLLIDYDVEMRENATSSDQSAQVFMEFFNVIAEHPELNQEFDLKRIFKHIARANGVKNVREFYRDSAQVMPNDQVVREAEKGNIVPQT